MSQLRQGKQLHNEFTCEICYMQYNKTSRIPLIICSREHMTCSYCINAIKKNKKCPFCREPLNFDRIQVSTDICKRLPDDPGQPNIRFEKKQPTYFHLSPASSQIASNQLDEGILLEMQQDWEMVRMYQLEQTDRKRKLIYVVTFFLVLPFFLLDLNYALFSNSQPQCTDIKRLFGVINFRTWLFIISSIQGTYLIIFLLSIIKRKCGNAYQELYLTFLEQLYSFGIIAKGIICCIAELFLFFGVVMQNCNGSIFVYGIILTVLHCLKILAFLLGMLRHWCC